MKFLGIDTSAVKLLGKLTFTNTTEFPIVVSVWQTGPLYYRVLLSNETWSTNCGSVWFTVKAWLYNGENNINPGIKYSLLAGNIVGFAALGAVGLGATALVSHHGVSLKNPDWEEWLAYNQISNDLDDNEVMKGIHSISRCEFSRAGIYAGSHPHLFVSGGPVRETISKKSVHCFGGLELEWHELRIDSCAFRNNALPLILVPTADDTTIKHYRGAGDNSAEHARSGDLSPREQLHLVNVEDEGPAPELPKRPMAADREERPPVPQRPSRNEEAGSEKYHYEINT